MHISSSVPSEIAASQYDAKQKWPTPQQVDAETQELATEGWDSESFTCAALLGTELTALHVEHIREAYAACRDKPIVDLTPAERAVCLLGRSLHDQMVDYAKEEI